MDTLINILNNNNLDLAFGFFAIFVVCEIVIIQIIIKYREKIKWLIPLCTAGFISIFLAMPFILNEVAIIKSLKNNNVEAIKYEEMAIEFSFLPVQKGLNYISLSRFYQLNKNGRAALQALNKAHFYFKGYYDHPAWKNTYQDWYIFGQFTKVIDLLNNSNIYNIILPETYILLGDIESAHKYLLNVGLLGYEEYALLGYITKIKDGEEKGIEYYNKALEMVNNAKQGKIVDAYYDDAINYITSKLNARRKQINLHPFKL